MNSVYQNFICTKTSKIFTAVSAVIQSKQVLLLFPCFFPFPFSHNVREPSIVPLSKLNTNLSSRLVGTCAWGPRSACPMFVQQIAHEFIIREGTFAANNYEGSGLNGLDADITNSSNFCTLTVKYVY